MEIREIPADENLQFVDAPSVREISADEPLEFAESASPDEFFINRGIARSLGAPVDLVNQLLSVVGLDTETPFGGSQSIESGFRGLGANVPQPGEEPQTLLGNIAQGVGDVAGGAGVAGPLLKTTALGGRLLGGIAQAPAATAAGEIVAGAGAGTGGFIAEQEFPDTPGARAFGEIIGGLSPSVAGRVLISTPSAIALRTMKKTVAPFTQGGATPRASDRVQALSSDPESAARELDIEPLTNLSPAQRTGDKSLLSLEAAVRAKNADLDNQLQVRIETSQEDLTRSIVETGDVSAPRDIIAARREALSALIEARARQAAIAADDKIAALGVKATEADLSRVMKGELSSALDDAVKQEGELWDLVPRTVKVKPDATREAYVGSLARRAATDDPADIPDFVRDFLGRGLNKKGALVGGKFVQKEQSVRDMHGLRSRVLRERREEAGKPAPSGKKISLLDSVADGLTSDINSAAGNESFDTARQFSADLNEKFRRGAVGRVLGFDRVGGSRVEPEQVLRSAIGSTGVAGEAGMRQLMAAVGDSQQAKEQVRQFLLTRFNEAHIRDGNITGNARGFLDKNEGVFRQFPETRRQIENAIDARILADTRRDISITRQRRLNSPQSDTQRFLNARIGEEADTIFTSKTPAETARNLARTVRNDPESLQGFRAAVVQSVLKKVRTPNITESGIDVLDARKLANFLRNDQNKRAVSMVLGGNKLNRLVRVQKELQALEAAQKARPATGGIISDLPNSVLSTMARISGAQVGRQIAGATGGGTVQTPGIVSTGVQRFLRNVTNDKAEALLIKAITDDSPETLNLLLTNTRNGQKTERAMRKLNAFLAGPAATTAQEE